jgi:hypothetical protein
LPAAPGPNAHHPDGSGVAFFDRRVAFPDTALSGIHSGSNGSPAAPFRARQIYYGIERRTSA